MENSLNKLLNNLNRDLEEKKNKYNEVVTQISYYANSLKEDYKNNYSKIEEIIRLTRNLQELSGEIKTIEQNINYVTIEIIKQER